MQVKSLVIVLGSVKYGDSSVILKTFSQDYGLISFIAGGVRGKKGPLKPSMSLPLNQFEAVFYFKSKGELKRLKEVSHPHIYETLFYDPIKNCLSMFLAEVLTHVLHEDEPQPSLYDFLSSSLYLLDSLDKGISNFHLIFLYHLTSYLGFQPESVQEYNFFDLQDGLYCSTEPMHSHFLKGKALSNWKILSKTSFEDVESFKMNNDERTKLLQLLIIYYRLHIKDFGELKSLEVLHTILN